MINLRSDLLDIVKNILRQYVAGRRVVVFGSRIKSKVKPYSDLDLCIMGDIPLSSTTIDDMKDEFSESDLPIRVDIIDWAITSPEFRAVIEEHCEVLKF
jgi:predicted nucleotidyltransferase